MLGCLQRCAEFALHLVVFGGKIVLGAKAEKVCLLRLPNNK